MVTSRINHTVGWYGWTIGLLFSVLFIGSIGCTASHNARTVGDENLAIEASFGGPFFQDLGFPMPIPNLLVGARYGITEYFDVSGSLNLFTIVMPGLMDLQTAIHFAPIQPGLRTQEKSPQQGWSLLGTIGIHWITDFQNGFTVIPWLETAVGYRYNWINPFVGCALGLNFYQPFHQSNPFIFNPYLGADFILSERVSFGFRVTVFDPNQNSYGSNAQWVPIVNHPEEGKELGAWGLTLGFAYTIHL
jgi:hypothetical protein